MKRQTYDLIVAKIHQKSLNMHYSKLNKIKISRNKRLSTSISINNKPNLKKEKIQQDKISQIQKNNMILFTKISSIYNRDAFNKTIKKPNKKHSIKRQLAFSQLKIQEQNRTGFYDRLCLMKPTINNQKILQQRRKELRILKFLGRFSEHNLQAQVNKNSNSYRIHSTRQEKLEVPKKTKTQGNFLQQTANDENTAYRPSERPKYKQKEKPTQLKYTSQNFHNKINSQINLINKRYSQEDTQNLRKALKSSSKNTTNSRYLSTNKQKCRAQTLKGQLIVYECIRKLNKKSYNIQILKKQSFYEIICWHPSQTIVKLSLKIKQQKCIEMLQLLDYNYELFLTFLQLKDNKLSLSFNSYKFSNNNKNQTKFSHISQINEEESNQQINADTIQQEQDIIRNRVQKTSNNFYQAVKQKSNYYKKIQDLSIKI